MEDNLNDFSYEKFVDYINKSKKQEDVLNYLNQFVPETLYKYYKLPAKTVEPEKRTKRLRLLSNEEVWLSKKAVLNDPFELDMIVIHHLNDYERKYYQEVCDKNVFFCMTKGYDNKLMWSHYANGHKGYCVEYKRKKAGVIYPVEYVSKRMDYTKEYHEFLNMRNKKDLYMQKQEQGDLISWALSGMKCMKEACWNYEQEYRMVESTDDGTGKRIKAKDLGLEISKIILGLKCTQQDAKDLEKICKQINIRRIKQTQKRKNITFIQAEEYLMMRNRIVTMERVYCNDDLDLYTKKIEKNKFI